jgi:LemA protein
VEDNLQYARRYYNGCVRNYNTRVQSFPGLLVAKLCGYRVTDFFEVEYATERSVPEVRL